MNPIVSFLSGLVSPITEVVKGWQERKRVKLEGDIAVTKAQTQAKVRYFETAQQQEAAWENLSIQNAGWKDEWFVIVLSIPSIMSFIPWLQQYVFSGFDALNKTPEWYQWLLMIAVASSFGYKKVADVMAIKRSK